MADLSFDEIRRRVQAAITAARGSELYVCELYADKAIWEQYGEGGGAGKIYESPYTISDEGAVELGDAVEVQRETVYTAVKFVDGTDGMIEGLAIPYIGPLSGGKDVQGERFTPDTDLCLDWFPDEGRPFLFQHGLDAATKTAIMGRQVERDPMDIGQWVKVQLDKRSKYLKGLQELVDQEALSFSSGSFTHLARTDRKGNITVWPWVELSGTPTPANIKAGAYAVKTAEAIEHLTAVKATAALESIAQSESGLESEPFAVHADRIAEGLDALARRAELRRDWRAKAGRGLSAANRTELAEIVGALGPTVDAHQRLSDLLARTDPDATEASKAAEQEYLRFLREQARQNGALVGAD